LFFKNNLKINQDLVYIKKINNLFKVYVGDFSSYQKAKKYKEQNYLKGFIIK